MIRRIAPGLTLVILAPFIAEVLSGATRVSFFFAFIPEVMVWGCGALLIREIVHRWNAGWQSSLLLGLALAMAEEFVIQQTSIAPLPWLAANASYGRALGVNWLYLLYMLGYESVWVVIIPIAVTELIFVRRRGEAWASKVGLAICGFLFLVGSFIAWFLWTQIARPKVFHAPKYSPPPGLITAGLLAICAFVLVAYFIRRVAHRNRRSVTPNPVLTAVVIAVLCAIWEGLLVLIFAPNPTVPDTAAIAGGLLWAALAYFVLSSWTMSPSWQDAHRWTGVCATVVVSMAVGFSGSESWPPTDLIGKAIMNIAALIGMVFLWRAVRTRSLATRGAIKTSR